MTLPWQESSPSSTLSHADNNHMVDIVSLAMVMQGCANNENAETQQVLDYLLEDTNAKNDTKIAFSEYPTQHTSLHHHSYMGSMWSFPWWANCFEQQLVSYWNCDRGYG
jgi:hypothetical protein